MNSDADHVYQNVVMGTAMVWGLKTLSVVESHKLKRQFTMWVLQKGKNTYLDFACQISMSQWGQMISNTMDTATEKTITTMLINY